MTRLITRQCSFSLNWDSDLIFSTEALTTAVRSNSHGWAFFILCYDCKSNCCYCNKQILVHICRVGALHMLKLLTLCQSCTKNIYIHTHYKYNELLHLVYFYICTKHWNVIHSYTYTMLLKYNTQIHSESVSTKQVLVPSVCLLVELTVCWQPQQTVSSWACLAFTSVCFAELFGHRPNFVAWLFGDWILLMSFYSDASAEDMSDELETLG